MEGIQTSLFDDVPRFKIKNKVRLIELFAGIGSQAKSLERLRVDFEHYRVCEFDRFAVQSYNAIHCANFEPSDIRRWKGADLGIEDTDKYTYILAYSFPCTDLSVCGKMQGMSRNSGTRSGLLWEVERLLKETEKLPQVLLMENVPQVCGGQNISDFEEWLKFLESLGYANFYKILNAKDYGVPQNRERCYMVSLLGNYYYDFPKPKKLEKTLFDYLEFNPKYKLKEKTMTECQKKNAPLCAIRIENEIAKTIRCGGSMSFSKKHNFDIYCVDIQTREDFMRMRRGQSKTILAQHDLFYTVDGKEYYIYSAKEKLLLMDFDAEDYKKMIKKGVSENKIAYQAGNSIVVAVLEAIFGQLFDDGWVN